MYKLILSSFKLILLDLFLTFSPFVLIGQWSSDRKQSVRKRGGWDRERPTSWVRFVSDSGKACFPFERNSMLHLYVNATGTSSALPVSESHMHMTAHLSMDKSGDDYVA